MPSPPPKASGDEIHSVQSSSGETQRFGKKYAEYIKGKYLKILGYSTSLIRF
jgi:hypothetical protein